MKEICNISPAEEHDFQIVTVKWQTVDYAQYQILDHSKERFVCKRCGRVVDAFPELKGN